MRKLGVLVFATILVASTLAVADRSSAVHSGCAADAMLPFLGPDGRVWFSEPGDMEIGAIDTAGSLTEFHDPGLESGFSHTIGPDGNLWGTGSADRIFRVAPTGAITVFPLPDFDVSGPSGSEFGLAWGPDAKLWMLAMDNRADFTIRFLKIDLDGSWTLGPQGVFRDNELKSGRMVFAAGEFWTWEDDRDGAGDLQLVRIAPDGTKRVAFVATSQTAQAFSPTLGPDGAIWSMLLPTGSTRQIVRVHPDGTQAVYDYPYPIVGGSGPILLTDGPDGRLWMADNGRRALVSVDMTGGFASFPYASDVPATGLTGFTFGSDGNVWYTTTHDIAAMSLAGQSLHRQTLPRRAHPPYVFQFAPNYGAWAGGTTVTIKGCHFNDTTAVWFGNARATQFTVVSDTVLKVVAPRHATGDKKIVQVTVESPLGRSESTQFTSWRYVPAPVVQSVCRGNGPASGGTTVTLFGQDLDFADKAYFGTTSVDVTHVVTDNAPYFSQQEVTVVTPPGPLLARVSIHASGPFGVGPNGPKYTYTPIELPFDGCSP